MATTERGSKEHLQLMALQAAEQAHRQQTGGQATAPAKPPRPVQEIDADLAKARAEHRRLLGVVHAAEAAWNKLHTQWFQSRNAFTASLKAANAGVDNLDDNPYLAGAIGPEPKPDPSYIPNCNALHSLAYLLAGLEEERAAWSAQQASAAYRDGRLAAAGITLDIGGPTA